MNGLPVININGTSRDAIVEAYTRVCDAIYQKIDAAIADAPDSARYREHFYCELLRYFDCHGVIPDFSLMKAEYCECNAIHDEYETDRRCASCGGIVDGE